MNKKGFVFIETIVVLVVVVLSLTILLMSYNLIESKAEAKKYYDHPRDIYLLYSIGNYINTNKIDDDLSLTDPSTRRNCKNKFMGKMVSDCEKMYNDLGIVSISIINDLDDLLKNDRDIFDKYDNGAIEYLKTLQRKKNQAPIRYIFGEFNRGNSKYYYASIPI